MYHNIKIKKLIFLVYINFIIILLFNNISDLFIIKFNILIYLYQIILLI